MARVDSPMSMTISFTKPKTNSASPDLQPLQSYISRIICSEWCILHHEPAHDTDDKVCEVWKTGKYQIHAAQDLMERPELIWRELITDEEVDRLLKDCPRLCDTRTVMAHILKLDSMVRAYGNFVTERDQLALLARQVVKDELQDGGLARWDILMRTCASHSHSLCEYITAHIERLEDDWIINPLKDLMQRHYSHQPGILYTRREMIEFAKVFDGRWPTVDQSRLSHDIKKVEYLAQLNADVRERLAHATVQIPKYRPEVFYSELLLLCFRLPYNCVVKSTRTVASCKGTFPLFTWPDIDEQRRKLSLAWRQDNL